MKWKSITIENHESYIEWIAIEIEGKAYSGFWQRGNSLTDKEIEIILSILTSKTDTLYTRGDK